MKTKEELIQAKRIALIKHSNGEPLTLEETALAIWDPETSKRPMSNMGVLKIQNKALDKLKAALKKYNIHGIDDMFSPKRGCEFTSPMLSADA